MKFRAIHQKFRWPKYYIWRHIWLHTIPWNCPWAANFPPTIRGVKLDFRPELNVAFTSFVDCVAFTSFVDSVSLLPCTPISEHTQKKNKGKLWEKYNNNNKNWRKFRFPLRAIIANANKSVDREVIIEIIMNRAHFWFILYHLIDFLAQLALIRTVSMMKIIYLLLWINATRFDRLNSKQTG